MAICLDQNSFSYVSLFNELKGANKGKPINKCIFEGICSYYLENYGRFPYIHEFPNTDTSDALKSNLEVNTESEPESDGYKTYSNINHSVLLGYLNIDLKAKHEENKDEGELYFKNKEHVINYLRRVILNKLRRKHSDLLIESIEIFDSNNEVIETQVPLKNKEVIRSIDSLIDSIKNDKNNSGITDKDLETKVIEKLNEEDNIRIKNYIIGNKLYIKESNKNKDRISSIQKTLIEEENKYEPDFKTDFNFKYSIKFKHAPTVTNLDVPKAIEDANSVPDRYNLMMLKKDIQRAMSYMNKYVIPITDAELALKEWDGIIDNDKITKAFIYRGNIYINIDHAGVNDYIHEYMHLILGMIHASNSELYSNILNVIKSTLLDNNEIKQEKYLEYYTLLQSNRYIDDIMEEIAVRELTAFMTGQSNIFSKINDNKFENNLFNVFFNSITQIFSGKFKIEDEDVLKYPIKILHFLTESSVSEEIKKNLNTIEQNRIRSNVFEKLVESNQIIKECK